MKRREFLAASTAVGLAPWAMTHASEEGAGERCYLELRTYQVETDAQRKEFDAFAADAAIPALNRAGIGPVGVFHPIPDQADPEDKDKVYVLLPHKSAESAATLVQTLGADSEFVSSGADFLEAPAATPAYKRMTSSLMIAFKGMPKVEIPITSPDRIFELRVYQSPSVVAGQKKIEMFNDAGEIAIFRRTGLHPVFFGETLIGGQMPNLTYMLSFENMAQRKKNWGTFVKDPEWKRISKMEEYLNKNILCGIKNYFLKPAACSQI